MKITKKEMPLIMHGVLVVALFCLLFVSVAVLMNNSVAWFSQNKKVDASGMSVSLKDLGITDKYYAKYGTQTDYTEITSWAHLFEKLMPGDTVSIKAEYQSTEEQPRNLKVFFKALDETPLIKTKAVSDGATTTTTDYYYYFGSQLKITTVQTYKAQNGVVDETTKTESNPTDQFLVTPSDNKVSYTAEVTPNEIELTVFENMTSGTTYTLEFTVQFENYTNIDQNDYQGFGKTYITENPDGTTTETTFTNPDGTTPNCLWQLLGIVEE